MTEPSVISVLLGFAVVIVPVYVAARLIAGRDW
jgi:hypothetical protein